MITWTKELKEKAAAYYGINGKTGIAAHLGLDITDTQVRRSLTTMKVLPKAGKVIHTKKYFMPEETRKRLSALKSERRRNDKELDRKIREGAQRFWNSEAGAAHKKMLAARLRTCRQTKSEEELKLWNKRLGDARRRYFEREGVREAYAEAKRKYWSSGTKEVEEVRERVRAIMKQHAIEARNRRTEEEKQVLRERMKAAQKLRWAKEGDRERQSEVARNFGNSDSEKGSK